MGRKVPATKTTLYLPDDLKRAISAEASRRGASEAEVIRSALRERLTTERPRPRPGLFSSHAPTAREADRHLAGFGKR
jgi:plasmid stability protein